tara:strand:+ start:634 stop:861 length:228 start_codon:yes stop_codon:yes gene_type:complete
MIGVKNEIKNKEVEHTQESLRYIRVTVFCKTKKDYINLLLTANDYDRMINRAEKNKEDCYQPGWWEKFVHWFIRG